MHRGMKSGKSAPPRGVRPVCDNCGWSRTAVVAERADGTALNLCEACTWRWFDAESGEEWRPADEVVYQVDLCGPFAKLTAAWLSDMVKCTCRRCGIILLAEGAGHRRAARLAEETGRQLAATCGPCLRAVTGLPGPLPRGIADNPRHQAEFDAAVGKLDAGRN